MPPLNHRWASLSPLSLTQFPHQERRGVVSYPSLSRQGDAFQHDAHIGPVNAIQFSPFHRNLFLTGGQDGSVRLYHLLEQTPLRQWEPSPPPEEADMDNPFAAISCVSFSYTRPTVFAVGSKDGYVYLFDLLTNLSGPVTTLRLPPIGITSTGNLSEKALQGGGSGGGKKLSSDSSGHRPRVTGLSFNGKQRDLLSVCDSTGRVLVWKVGWNFANQKSNELNYFEKLGNISVSNGGEQEEQQREAGGGAGEGNDEEA